MSEVELKCKQAKAAAREMAVLGTSVKDKALLAMADAFEANKAAIFEANKRDLAAAQAAGLSGAMLKRLELTDKKIAQMADGVRQIAGLRDPVGETIEGYIRPNGMEVRKVRVPIGVIGIIYESRPNVTADAAALCLKAGNAVILRGGSEAINSNLAIARLIREAASCAGVPEGAVQIIETTDRAAARELMNMKAYIDCLIPRGGKGLIRTVVENSTIPVIEHGDGNCHVYVDTKADPRMAGEIAFNAKVQNPSVCNAAETLLVSEQIAADFLPNICKRLADAGVEIRGCEKTRAIVPGLTEATEEDWETEYLDLILAVKVVSGVGEAIAHIAKYGSGHSEAIVTEDYSAAVRFSKEVDAAAVFVNVSTRFTDGYEFGKGAEMGIRTQKLHARGPMGLEEITTYKYVVTGSGQLEGIMEVRKPSVTVSGFPERIRRLRRMPNDCARSSNPETPGRTRSIGLMGGTFDPIHYGHLILAEQAWEQLGLERVIFVTAADPPHKSGQPIADARLRHEMVRMAVEGNAHFEASTLELDRGGVSYTIDTVRQIIADYGEGTRVYLLMGEDEAANLMSWREPHALAEMAIIVAASRPCSDALPAVPEDFAGRIVRLRMPAVDISSTELRERVRSGKSIRYLIPECVEEFIREKGLYRNGKHEFLNFGCLGVWVFRESCSRN